MVKQCKGDSLDMREGFKEFAFSGSLLRWPGRGEGHVSWAGGRQGHSLKGG